MTERVLVTGGAGLVGTACCRLFSEEGYHVVSVDNYARGDFFGEQADTEANISSTLDVHDIEHHQMDITDPAVRDLARDVDAVVHTAAQPSHPKSIEIPVRDFRVNVEGTLNLLETLRTDNPDAPFAFCSTNKVYGEVPNFFSYERVGKRFEPEDPALWNGFDESLRIDQNMHTPFGVSKAAADLYVQEYAKLYGLEAASFRMGCITGGKAKAVELHNWEPYFVKLALTGEELTVYGYEGYQVRDVVHADDLARLFLEYVEDPPHGSVFNVGGGRQNSISLLESFDLIEEVTGREMNYSYGQPREADHIWWISDTSKVRDSFDWEVTIGLEEIFRDIYEALAPEYE